MGSLFYINVPLRKYEIYLRKQEHQVKDDDWGADGHTYVTGSGTGSDGPRGSLIPATSIGSDNTSLEYNPGNLSSISSDGSLVPISSSSGPEVFEGVLEGKKVNLVISKDMIDVLPADSPRVTSSSGQKNKNLAEKEMDVLQKTIEKTFLEKHLEDCLKKFNIYDATFVVCVDGNFAQVSFTVYAERSEEIINYMLTLGIGLKYESTLSVCAAIVYYNEKMEAIKKRKALEEGRALEPGEKSTFGSKFVASIKSRLTVAQVIQSVQSNAVMTFDFIVLIIVAGIIAGLGLLESSSVNLVASMLISPLMGPIMAGCFGAVIRDWKLVKTGVISELVGLSICLLVGFFFGICVAWHPFDGPWANVDKWPTDEMAARSRLKGMVVGVFIAIPSGAGVALSILAGNAGSLVGVAISASLLPPAVNAGLFWGMATVISIQEQASGRSAWVGCHDWIGPENETMYTINHKNIYCSNVLREFGLMGICSFGLTLLNIVLILMSGAIVLKIKEVAPHTTRKTMSRFWKEDLKAMRDYNKEHGGYNQQALLNEIRGAGIANLANDRTLNQVTRRNVFGNGVNILETAEGRDMSREDIEHGNGEGQQQQTASTGLLSSVFGFFGRKTTTAPDSELVSEVGSPDPSNPQFAARRYSAKTVKHR